MIKKIAMLAFCFSLFISTNSFASHDSSLVKIGSDAVIEEGTTIDNVVVIMGDLTVNGTVSEDAVVIGGDLKVGPEGKIVGDSVVVFGKLFKPSGAEVNKNAVEIFPSGKTHWHNYMFPVMGLLALGALGLFILIGFLALFMLISFIFTGHIGKNSFYIQNWGWRSLFYGFLTSVLILPVILLLTVSIIGIPVVPLFIIVIIAASLFGYATMCQLVGLKFFKMIKRPGQHMLWEVIVGYIILALVIMIPFVGCLVKVLVWMTGLGATVATKFGTAYVKVKS